MVSVWVVESRRRMILVSALLALMVLLMSLVRFDLLSLLFRLLRDLASLLAYTSSSVLTLRRERRPV